MDSMYALGLPILQGAISTILGVIGLALAPSYIFITFFKMVFLVIVLGALHGIILLPVLLSLFGPGACCGHNSGRSSKNKDKKKRMSLQHQSSQNNVPISSQPQSTQTYLDEGKVELAMKIPRPKRSCGKHTASASASQSEVSNGVAYQPHLNGGHHGPHDHSGGGHVFDRQPRSHHHYNGHGGRSASHSRSRESRSKSRDSRSTSKESGSVSVHSSGVVHHRHHHKQNGHHRSHSNGGSKSAKKTSAGSSKSGGGGDPHSLKLHEMYTNRAFQD